MYLNSFKDEQRGSCRVVEMVSPDDDWHSAVAFELYMNVHPSVGVQYPYL